MQQVKCLASASFGAQDTAAAAAMNRRLWTINKKSKQPYRYV